MKGKAESYVEMCLASMDTDSLVESVAEGDTSKLRAFYDSGELHFCTLDDVMIQPGNDYRLDAVQTLVNEFEWPVDFPLKDSLDGFEGTPDDLINLVSEHVACIREVAQPVKPKKPKREKSVAQKQGARQAGRTRRRHAENVTEGFGAIYHEYYARFGDVAKKFFDYTNPDVVGPDATP